MLNSAGHAHLVPVKDLEDYDVAFLEHLRAEAETTVDKDHPAKDLHKVYEDIVDRYDRNVLTKADLYALDRVVLSLASSAELRAEAPGLYQRYCEERGENVDPLDPTMKPLTPQAKDNVAEMESLRARLLQILRTLHWSYTFGPLREKTRVKLIVDAMWGMVFATIVLGILLGAMRMFDGGHGHPFFAVLITVVYAGLMGGMVSCTRRLSEVPIKGDALGSIYALKNSRYILYFAPLTGAVFAVITMLLFMGQVLTGIAFPTFQELKATNAVSGEWHFTHSLLLASSKDYALLFLWCFISGFAERFIPDTLTGLTQRASAQAKAGGNASIPTQGTTVQGSGTKRDAPAVKNSNGHKTISAAKKQRALGVPSRRQHQS